MLVHFILRNIFKFIIGSYLLTECVRKLSKQAFRKILSSLAEIFLPKGYTFKTRTVLKVSLDHNLSVFLRCACTDSRKAELRDLETVTRLAGIGITYPRIRTRTTSAAAASVTRRNVCSTAANLALFSAF